MVIGPYDQYQRLMEAQTVTMKDKKAVVKMVSPVAQAMSEIKREYEIAECKIFLPPLQRDHVYRSNPDDYLYYEGPVR